MNTSQRMRHLQHKIAFHEPRYILLGDDIAAWKRELEELENASRTPARYKREDKEEDKKEDKHEEIKNHRPCRNSPKKNPQSEINRARGCDRSWAAKLGLYLLAKEMFLAMHPARATYFWNRFDAYWLGRFLENRPNLTEAQLRVMLANYHATGLNRFAAAQHVFRVLGRGSAAKTKIFTRERVAAKPTPGPRLLHWVTTDGEGKPQYSAVDIADMEYFEKKKRRFEQ